VPRFKIGIDVTFEGESLQDAKQKVTEALKGLNPDEVDFVEEEELEDEVTEEIEEE
jgi:ABC-type uncharacterized transport system substrate-binding protein